MRFLLEMIYTWKELIRNITFDQRQPTLHKKMKYSVKNVSSKIPKISGNLVTFNGEILN